jgi:predicted AAA+ superfamily ATPase
MEQYVLHYIQRDIARLFPGLNQNRFRLFIQLLAGLSGTIINYSDVSRSLGVSVPTVQDYFNIAHGSFLWRSLPAFEKKSLKRLVKHPKGYMRDTGLLHHFLRVSDEKALLTHPHLGSFWEGFVIEEVLRGLNARGVDHTASYYRTGGGAEVDLVLEGSFGLLPIEIKYTQTLPLRKLKSLADFISENKCKFGVIINNDEAIRFYANNIIGIPFSYL